MPEQSQTGDDCPQCDGHLVVYSGHQRGAMHVRYLRCWRCQAAPENNKLVVPATEVTKRRSRKCPNNVSSPAVNPLDSAKIEA